jgi:hypothetical protein
LDHGVTTRSPATGGSAPVRALLVGLPTHYSFNEFPEHILCLIEVIGQMSESVKFTVASSTKGHQIFGIIILFITVPVVYVEGSFEEGMVVTSFTFILSVFQPRHVIVSFVATATQFVKSGCPGVCVSL